MAQLLAPLREDPIAAVPWHGAEPPSRVLVIRLQAFGDTVATLPYVAALKRLWMHTEFDVLTREEVADLPRSVDLFTNVFALRGRRDWRRQALFSLLLLRQLIARRYEVVIDLQRNRVSHFVRRALRPPAWSEYDRYSPRLGGERTRLTIEALGVRLPPVYPELRLRQENVGLARLRDAGWSGGDVVVLNPAGGFPTRNWPLPNYVAFADLWRTRRGHEDQFAVLGTPQLRAKADYLKATLADRLLDLVGRTSASEAFDILRRATLVVSEDSGLMHLAWVSGAPTLGLLGSSRHVWSAPHGNYSLCLHSGDLPCGACMDTECRFGDVHCLTRYTPERVVAAALTLLDAVTRTQKVIWPGKNAEA